MSKLLIVVRVRGTTDISSPQRIVLNRLGLKKINTAVFLKGTAGNIRLLKKVENYITWGEAGRTLVRELVFRKMYGKVGEERVQIKSNAQVEEHLGGQLICLEDVIEELLTLGKRMDDITAFVYPFKLTTPEGTLASRLRKPVEDNGHWGYRGEDINRYVQLMI